MLSVIASVWSTSPKTIEGQDHDGTPFYLFSTQFYLMRLICSGGELWICILRSVDRISRFHHRPFGVVNFHAGL